MSSGFEILTNEQLADLKEKMALELTQMQRDRIVQQKNLDGSRFATLKESTIIQKLGGKNKTGPFNATAMNAEIRMMRTQDFYKFAFKWSPIPGGLKILISPLPHKYQATMKKKMSKKGASASYKKVSYQDIASFQLNSSSPFYQGKLSKGNVGANFFGTTKEDVNRIGKKIVKPMQNDIRERFKEYLQSKLK